METVERLHGHELRLSAEDRPSVDPLDILLVLADRWRMIAIVTVGALFFGTLIAFLLRPKFTATAIILPPQQQSSSSALLSQLGPLASFGGGSAAALGLKSPGDLYVGILESRTIADEVIDSFHLREVYRLTTMQQSRAALKAHSEILAGKDGLIHISVTDHDAKRASDIANAYVSKLYEMNANLAITEAAQRRAFFDQQLEGVKKSLAAAEEDLRATQQRTGIIQLSGQAEMIIRTIAELRAGIDSRQVELQAMRTFATEQNPDVNRLQEEISTMKAQLAKLENDQQRQVQPGDISMPAGRVPEDSLEYARKYREVKYNETLLDLLSRQYEAARIDEAKSAPIIQVIDKAVPPDMKSGPPRLAIALGLGVLGFFLACLAAFLQHGLEMLAKQPERAEKLLRLRLALRRNI